MLAVQTYLEQVKAANTAEVKIACYNSPQSVTLSGGNDNIEAIARLF
jgi:emericellamide synthase (highly reducing iterative type I polyketide synthase)